MIQGCYFAASSLRFAGANSYHVLIPVPGRNRQFKKVGTFEPGGTVHGYAAATPTMNLIGLSTRISSMSYHIKNRTAGRVQDQSGCW